MIPLGLTATEQARFNAQLRTNAQIRVRVRMQNLSGDTLAELTDRLVDGQVNIDTTAETDRQASLTLHDPKHTLDLDSNAPGDGALYADRMIRIDYGIFVTASNEWVDVPIFTGPVVQLERNGGLVDVSCLGKEHLAKGQAWRPLHIGKGTNTAAAIRWILAERAGEDRFAFGSTLHRLPAAVDLDRMGSPWEKAKQLAASMGRQLYYDGAGVCRLRTPPGNCVFTFDEQLVTSDPKVAFDTSTIINLVWVKGYQPKGKPRVTGTAVAPTTHPLSPGRLGRNGVPHYLVELIEQDSVRSVKDANALAASRLNHHLLEGVTATFDALPIPHLDPGDVVRLATDNASITFRLQQASIPLTHSGLMSVGSTKRVSVRKGAIRG